MHNLKNIFEIWRGNGEKLPFKARIDSWCEKHFVVVERVEIGKWSYGQAFGQYYFYGKPGDKTIIKNSGTYRWTLVE